MRDDFIRQPNEMRMNKWQIKVARTVDPPGNQVQQGSKTAEAARQQWQQGHPFCVRHLDMPIKRQFDAHATTPRHVVVAANTTLLGQFDTV